MRENGHMASIKLAIVGFGATGLSGLIQIIERAATANDIFIKTIYIISHEDEFVGGCAFTVPDHEHLLNTPARLMSCYPDMPNHFSEWLRMRGIASDYPARFIFQQYLFDQYARAKERAQQLDIVLVEIKQIAVAIKLSHQHGYCLTLSSGEDCYVDKVIYAPGQPMTGIKSSLFAQDKQTYQPFKSHQFLNVQLPMNERGELAVIGSGLSAVDAVLSLRKRIDIKRIHIYSRCGMLPSINQRNPYDQSWLKPPRYFTIVEIKRLLTNNAFSFQKAVRLIWKDLSLYPLHELQIGAQFLRTHDYRRYYRKILYLARRNFTPLCGLLASTRDYFSDLWRLASTQQKIEFQRFARHWTLFRHPLPYNNGIKLLQLLEEDRLCVHVAKDLHIADDHVRILTAQGVKRYPGVIGAEARDFDFRRSASPFDKSLFREGLVQPHPFGGIYVCPHTLCARPGFYAAGEIVRGVFYSTNAFWFNVRLTQRIADCIFSTP